MGIPFLSLLFMFVLFPTDIFAGALSKLVVVLDPGHGGKDPGANGIFSGQEVFESPYVYDIAKRIERGAIKEEGRVFLTIKAENGIRDWPASKVFPLDRSHVFSLDGSGVRAGSDGLTRRVLFANWAKKQYPERRSVFVSIHFDKLGENKEIEGMRIIAADSQSRLVLAIKGLCAKLLRENTAVVKSGDKNHGIPNVFVLRGWNRIPERVLVELGNFNNPADVWRIRNHENRQKYATCIVDALKKL